MGGMGRVMDMENIIDYVVYGDTDSVYVDIDSFIKRNVKNPEK